jgi:hypothetical protein
VSLKSDSASKWLSTNIVVHQQPDEHISEEALCKSGTNFSQSPIGHKKINVHIHQQLAYLLDPEGNIKKYTKKNVTSYFLKESLA